MISFDFISYLRVDVMQISKDKEEKKKKCDNIVRHLRRVDMT